MVELTFPRPPRNPQSRRHYSSRHRAFFRAKSSWCALGVRLERAQHRTRGAARGSSSVVVGAAVEHRRRLMHAGWMDGSLSLRRASGRPTERVCSDFPSPALRARSPTSATPERARPLAPRPRTYSSVYMQSANFRACHCQSPSLALASSFPHFDFTSGAPQLCKPMSTII